MCVVMWAEPWSSSRASRRSSWPRSTASASQHCPTKQQNKHVQSTLVAILWSKCKLATSQLFVCKVTYHKHLTTSCQPTNQTYTHTHDHFNFLALMQTNVDCRGMAVGVNKGWKWGEGWCGAAYILTGQEKWLTVSSLTIHSACCIIQQQKN